MTLSKLLRLLVPATLVFAFATPAWADGEVMRIKPSIIKSGALARAINAAKKAPPAAEKPAKAKPVAKRPALPIRRPPMALPRR